LREKLHQVVRSEDLVKIPFTVSIYPVIGPKYKWKFLKGIGQLIQEAGER